MPHPDYIPRRDQEALAWSNNFVQQVARDPQAFGLSAEAADELVDLQALFHDALSRALDPATRTRSAVLGKNLARKQLVAALRRAAALVRAHAGLTDAGRADLGLPIPGQLPEPAGAPQSRPLLCLGQLIAGRGEVRILDESLAGGRGKPRGMLGANLFIKVGGEAPRGVDECAYAMLATRSIVTLEVPTGATGQRVWLIGRWVNRRGEQGPASAVASRLAA